MRVLVCGDRKWVDKGLIRDCLHTLFAENGDYLVLIEGEARGADRLARECAEEDWNKVECPIKKFPADWNNFGRTAGPIRNQQMLREGKPDLVLAFHDDLKNSKGTKDMINRAKKA